MCKGILTSIRTDGSRVCAPDKKPTSSKLYCKRRYESHKKRKLSPKACIQPLLPDGLCWGHIHGAWAGVGPKTGLWWGCGNCGGYASCWPPTVSGLPRPYFWDLLSHIQTGLLIAMPRFVSLKDHEPPSMKSFIKSCCFPGFWGWTSSLLP